MRKHLSLGDEAKRPAGKRIGYIYLECHHSGGRRRQGWVRQPMQDNCDSVPWQRRKPLRLELNEGPLVVRACPPFNDPVERKHVRSAKLPQTPTAIGPAV